METINEKDYDRIDEVIWDSDFGLEDSPIIIERTLEDYHKIFGEINEESNSF